MSQKTSPEKLESQTSHNQREEQRQPSAGLGKSWSGFHIRKNIIKPISPKFFLRHEPPPSDIRSVLLVAATLIAAVTFQAGVNPPGGVWQDESPDQTTLDQRCLMTCLMKCLNQTCLVTCLNQTCLNQPPDSNQVHHAGQAIYAAHPIPFHFFLICNTLALSTSLVLLISITYGCPFFLEVLIATLSMAGTYAASIFGVTPYANARFRLIALVAAGPIIIRFVIWIVPRFIKCGNSTDSGPGKTTDGHENGQGQAKS